MSKNPQDLPVEEETFTPDQGENKPKYQLDDDDPKSFIYKYLNEELIKLNTLKEKQENELENLRSIITEANPNIDNYYNKTTMIEEGIELAKLQLKEKISAGNYEWTKNFEERVLFLKNSITYI